MALTDADRALHADRRRRLAQLLPDGCVAVLPAALEAHRNGEPCPAGVVYPTVQDGLRGVAFVDACVRSSARNAAWVALG